MSLEVSTQQKTLGSFIISFVGSLDSHTFSILEKEVNAIIDDSTQLIVFDMEKLDYVSSAGIRVIFQTQGALKKNEGKIVFMNLQPQIRKVFEIINAIPSMKIFRSIEELDEYLDVMQKKIKKGEI